MPEPYGYKNKNAYRLSDAERNGFLARLWCRYCKRELYFRMADLQQWLGDIEVDHVTDRHRWRCSGCRKTHTINIDTVLLSGVERQKITLRKLVHIYYVKKVVWQDVRE